MRPFLIVAITLTMVACATNPTTSTPAKRVVIPAGRDRAYDNYHYAPAIRVGDTVIVSGLVAYKGADYEEKVRNMFEELKRTLAAAGAELGDVVELNTFHAQVKDTAAFDEEFGRFLKIHNEYFPDHYPAWTAVGTTALLAEGAALEMRAMAVVGAGRAATITRQRPDVHAGDARALEHARAFAQGRAGRHHIIEHGDVRRQRGIGTHGKCIAHIAPACARIQIGLCGRRALTYQQPGRQRNSQRSCQRLGQLQCLIEAALTQASCV